VKTQISKNPAFLTFVHCEWD